MRGEVKKMKGSQRHRSLLALVVYLSVIVPAAAQHTIDVQKLSADGDHFKALAMYELLPTKKVGLDGKIAAAKSAWALGLNRQAGEGFDTILRDTNLPADTRTRLVLSRGVIEYQEERYQEATLFAEKAVGFMPEGAPLRGRAYLLWGQSLVRLGAFASAQERFTQALADLQAVDKPEAFFALGLVEMKLGKYQDAQKHLEAIPMDHDRTPVAIRMLASLALETRNYERAKFWIEKGRSDYPEAFIDSWGEYGLVQVAVARGDLDEARRVAERASQRFATSDAWIVLMNATIELAEWKRRESVRVG